MADVSRDSAVAYFNQQLSQPINGIANKWSTTNNPTGAASSYAPTALINNLRSGDLVADPVTGASLTPGNVSLSQLVSVLRTSAILLSRARMVRLCRTSYPYSSCFFDQTRVANMTDAFAIPDDQVPTASNEPSILISGYAIGGGGAGGNATTSGGSGGDGIIDPLYVISGYGGNAGSQLTLSKSIKSNAVIAVAIGSGGNNSSGTTSTISLNGTVILTAAGGTQGGSGYASDHQMINHKSLSASGGPGASSGLLSGAGSGGAGASVTYNNVTGVVYGTPGAGKAGEVQIKYPSTYPMPLSYPGATYALISGNHTFTFSTSGSLTFGTLPTTVAGFSSTISTAELNAFVDTLTTTITNWRNTTLSYTEYYCHSSCHSNHDSRSRR